MANVSCICNIDIKFFIDAEGKVGLARECVLTAFSLEPTIDRLNQLQRYSAFQTPMWRFHNFLPLDPCVGECHCIEKGLCRREPQVPSWFLTHVPNGILDSSLQGVSQQLLHDLCILVEGPRCRWLSWNIPWDSLCNICLSYLHSAREIRAESDDRGVGIDARLKRLGPFERISLTSFEVKSHSNKPLESDIHFVSVVDGDDDNPVFENSKDEFKNCVMDIIMTENVVSAEPSNGNLLENVPGLEHDLGKGSCASVKETEVILLDEDENPPVVRMNVETRTLKSDNDIELVLNMGKPDSLMTTSSLTKGEDVVDSVKETGDVAKVPALFSDENAIKQFTCEVQMDSSTSSLSKDEKETGLLTHSNCVIEDDGKTSTLARDKTDVLKNNSEVEKATNVPTLMPSCVKTTTSPNVLRTCRIVLEDISHKLPHFGNLISTTIGNSSKSTKVTNAGHASNTNLTGPQKSSCHQSSSHAPQAESTKKEHGDNDKKCHVTTSLTSSLADASRLGHLTILPSISGKPLIPFVVIDKLQDRHILSLANPSVSEEQNSSRIRTGDCSEITPEKLELKIESPISSSELSDGCLHECVSAVNTDSRKSNPAEHKKMSSLEKCKPLILSATKRG